MSMTTVANPRTLGPPRQPQPHPPLLHHHTHGHQPLPLDKRSSIWATLLPRELLGSALGLWRGEPLADLAYEPFAQGEIAAWRKHA